MATTEHDSLDSSKPISADNSELYEIKISGILDQHWQPWFEGLTLTTDRAVLLSRALSQISPRCTAYWRGSAT